MEKHGVLFLYLLSYISGIGAITLGYFFWRQGTGNKALQYGLYADLCLLGILLLNTFHYYQKMIWLETGDWFYVIYVYGLWLFAAGKVGYCTLTVDELLGVASGFRVRLMHGIGFILTLLTIGCLHFLSASKVLSGGLAIHSACTASTFLSLSGATYNGMRILGCKGEIGGKLGQMVYLLGLAGIIISFIAIFSDLAGFFYSQNMPVALSPVSYFTCNAIVLYFAQKYYRLRKEEKVASNPAEPDYRNFCDTYDITSRELDVIQLLEEGRSNLEIGKILYISVHTVRNHIYNIYRKTGVQRRQELVRLLQGKNTG